MAALTESPQVTHTNTMLCFPPRTTAKMLQPFVHQQAFKPCHCVISASYLSLWFWAAFLITVQSHYFRSEPSRFTQRASAWTTGHFGFTWEAFRTLYPLLGLLLHARGLRRFVFLWKWTPFKSCYISRKRMLANLGHFICLYLLQVFSWIMTVIRNLCLSFHFHFELGQESVTFTHIHKHTT